MQRTAFSLATGVLVISLLLAGCENGKGNRTSAGGQASQNAYDIGQDDPNAPWPFRPVDMRIHPLTHLTLDAAKNLCTIEARLEMLDMVGHSTKCYGHVRLELFDASSSGERAMKEWNEDLRILDTNQLRYDDVTRTYKFKLDIPLGELPDRPGLRVYFLSTTDETMQARHLLGRVNRP